MDGVVGREEKKRGSNNKGTEGRGHHGGNTRIPESSHKIAIGSREGVQAP